MNQNSLVSTLSSKEKIALLQSILEDTLDAIQEETGLAVHVNIGLHHHELPDNFYELAAAALLSGFKLDVWTEKPCGGSYDWTSSDPGSRIILYDGKMPHPSNQPPAPEPVEGPAPDRNFLVEHAIAATEGEH